MGEEKDIKKQEEKEASKKAVKAGAKALANSYAGPAAGQAVDLISKTKQGNEILDKGADLIQKNNPAVAKIANMANKTGALDALDEASGSIGSEKGTTSTSSSQKSPTSLKPNQNNNNNNTKEEVNLDASSKIFSLMKKHKRFFLSICGGFFLLFLLIIIVIVIVLGPVSAVNNFFSGIKDIFIGFLDDNQSRLEQEYYDELERVQMNINREEQVCIDVNLITAALTVDVSMDDLLNNGEEIIEDIEESSQTTISYKKMTKQVELLANMQIKHNKYSWDNSLPVKTGSKYCKNSSESTTTEHVTKDTEDRYEGYVWRDSNGLDSSSAELVARHDENNWLIKFFTKKSSDEKNYDFYLYQPSAELDCSTGTCIEKCTAELPDLEAELSIGDLNTMEDSVFYWNLVNSFIPDYYEEYLPDESDPLYLDKVKKIAGDIYLLYNDIGPSQTCSVSYNGPSSLCPNGITVDGVGTIDFEEYIAGVVSNEAYYSEGMEALKAQAVAARTYALIRTNYCQNSIANSTNAQTFTRNINDRAREAVNTTRGEILTYNGTAFSSQYDSFCYQDRDCPDSVRNSDGTYSVTYTREPNGEKHTITLNDPSQYSRILPGQGHANGMSQLVSYQMAKEGKNYVEILSYFYSEGVEVTFIAPTVGGSASSVASASVQEKLAYLFPAGLPGSGEEASQYMVTVEFPTVDINGVKGTKRATLHQSIAQDFVNIMTEIANSGFPIKDVGCYNWRSAAGSSSRSHHSYGVACDLNVNENYMIKNGQVLAGSYYRPGTDPYSFPADGVVVATFMNYGWGWGGSWNSSKDYMHFSFTGN